MHTCIAVHGIAAAAIPTRHRCHHTRHRHHHCHDHLPPPPHVNPAGLDEPPLTHTGALLPVQGRELVGEVHGARSSPNPVQAIHARALIDELDALLPPTPEWLRMLCDVDGAEVASGIQPVRASTNTGFGHYSIRLS